ncbi:unnamed protein product [Ambrosiozyma monospora]|uniref:Unnamed protein product n=1 Tax=Ambrosiozyma monospora TaxID=43982 RepID=A0A9W6T3C7_AMBMO|nr:unnamed protein product [Ambrosiozyma monospora]
MDRELEQEIIGQLSKGQKSRLLNHQWRNHPLFLDEWREKQPEYKPSTTTKRGPETAAVSIKQKSPKNTGADLYKEPPHTPPQSPTKTPSAYTMSKVNSPKSPRGNPIPGSDAYYQQQQQKKQVGS